MLGIAIAVIITLMIVGIVITMKANIEIWHSDLPFWVRLKLVLIN